MSAEQMKKQYTPGPWSAFAFSEPFNSADGVRSGWHINRADEPGYVTTVYWVAHRAAQCEANVRLITAAPELLATLKSLIQDITDAEHEPRDWSQQACVRDALAVIARAVAL